MEFMPVLYILVGLLVVIVLALWMGTRRPGRQPEPSRTGGASPSPRQTPVAPLQHTPDNTVALQRPAALDGFVRVRQEQLQPTERDVLLARLRTIPRPPKALHQLVSPEFLNTATSTALSDIVMGESLVAAKVLATVNSPAYNLQNPVVGMGQAITFLGMNTVRAICLRYLLDDAFRTPSQAGSSPFQPIWNASTLGSELCFRVAQHWRMPEAGALSTHVVLSFLGHLAATSLRAAGTAQTASSGFLERSQLEQAQLGLSAAEIGTLLMTDWALPAPLVADVRRIDHVLDTPPPTTTPAQTQVALAYASARLAECLATDPNFDLAAFEPATDNPDWFHLHQTLGGAGVQRLLASLRTPSVGGAVQHMARQLVTAAPSSSQNP
jgi:HD-like signal output (HDOD) protein